MARVIIFGAGKIGRSFIGQLFGKAGYHLVFVDAYKALVEQLNQKKKYNIVIKSDREELIEIDQLEALHLSDDKRIVQEIYQADIAAISVGKNNLDAILPILARGVSGRISYRKPPLDIIIAENMHDAPSYFSKELIKHSGNNSITQHVGLIETSIGKMVPIMTKEDLKNDPLQLFAEPYNNLILDKKGFRNPIPSVAGLFPKENMKAWVDRKIFIHNLGHAACVYFGHFYHPGEQYLYQILEDERVENKTREVMIQSGEILCQLYPGEFDINHVSTHVNDLISRFKNRHLKDTVFRVGTDLPRKLGSNDRFTRPITEGIRLAMPTNKIVEAYTFGFFFKATGSDGAMHPKDLDFHQNLEKGIEHVLTNVSGFSADELNVIKGQVAIKIEHLQNLRNHD